MDYTCDIISSICCVNFNKGVEGAGLFFILNRYLYSSDFGWFSNSFGSEFGSINKRVPELLDFTGSEPFFILIRIYKRGFGGVRSQ